MDYANMVERTQLGMDLRHEGSAFPDISMQLEGNWQIQHDLLPGEPGLVHRSVMHDPDGDLPGSDELFVRVFGE